jgi:ribosomal protein L11 methylase PrmA
MTTPVADPGSFRDPAGRVFIDGERVLRAVYPLGSADYRAVRESHLLGRLIEKKWLLESSEIEPSSSAAGAGANFLLEHPRVPFVSYPYEWPFSLHKRAALLQLDLLLDALEEGFTLSDATAYNIQFIGSEPRFIDHLSLRPYLEGEIWAAHRQFCMQFLNPLVMWSRCGVAPNSWFRGSQEGIAPEDLAPLLRWRDRFSWTLFSHVVLQGAAQRKHQAGDLTTTARAAPKLSRNASKATLMGLRSFIAASDVPRHGTVWDRYDVDNSYGAKETEAKHAFVRKMVGAVRPKILFVLGCNTGEYSATSIAAGAQYVVGFDFDFGALERAVERSSKDKLPFLPLWLDATNPSPSQGWNQIERGGFAQRARGDAVLALAFIHHLAIAKNIPLGRAVDWIMSVAPAGIIEFPPKSDPMVQQLLSRRADIFPHYDEQHFLKEVRNHGHVVATETLSPGGRMLVWYDRENTATRYHRPCPTLKCGPNNP